MEDRKNSQIKQELDEIIRQIDGIMEKIQAHDPVDDHSPGPEPHHKSTD